MLKNPLMLRNWKVLNAYLFETLCLRMCGELEYLL